jgi:hypothetical protein
MNRLRICSLFFAFAVIAARAEETNAPAPAGVTSAPSSGVTSNALPVSITIDGIIYSNVTWRTVTAATVTIFHSTGIAAIPLWKLPPELQKRFGYDPQKATAYLSVEQEREKAEQERAAARRKAEQQSAQLANLSETLLTDPFKAGMVGVSRNGQITVLQVVGPNDMRAEVYTEETTSVEDGYYQYDPNVTGYQELTPKYKKVAVSMPHEVWIKGIPTTGLVDGQPITRNDVLKVTGTKTFTTTEGTPRTIFLLEPLASVSPP